MHFEVNRKLFSRSDRVKSIDFHPTEPWLLCGLYNGTVTILSTTTGSVLKSFELATVPIRTVKFISRKSWFIAGSDDFHIRVYNYHTFEKITSFEAHPDYIRFLTVHPEQSIVLTASDDMSIKAWDWEKGWRCTGIFEGHTHYIMCLAFSPKDSNIFASACLDKTVKIWSLSSLASSAPVQPNYTLEPHEKGTNYISFYPHSDKPYLLTCSDDKTLKIFDYLSKSCVATLESHTANVSFAVWHPTLPIIISGSEDGTVKIWNANTYRVEGTLSYGLERAWCVSVQKSAGEGNGDVAIGFDEGAVVIRLGKEEPTFSMDSAGKLVYTKAQNVFSANLSVPTGDDGEEGKDGQKVELSPKDLGTSEIYPTTLLHSPNGRFITALSSSSGADAEYIIYTALAWRNKSFGSALSFAWGPDSNTYAVLENKARVKFFKNFKERVGAATVKGTIGNGVAVDTLYTGPVLGAKGTGFVIFWDWDSGAIVRRVDVDATGVYWSPNSLVLITTTDSFYILRFDRDAYTSRMESLEESGEQADDEGVEEAFDLILEGTEGIKTAKWIGDCLIYTTSSNRLSYLLSPSSPPNEETADAFTTTITPLDTPLYLLNYIPSHNTIYLADKEMNIFSYTLSLSFIEYQSAILHGDHDAAEELIQNIPSSLHNRIARFLEGRGMKEKALSLTTDIEHKFDLAISLSDLDLALSVAESITPAEEAEGKWGQLGTLALQSWRFDLALQCFRKSSDLSSLFLLATSTGDRELLQEVVTKAREKGEMNLAFAGAWQLSDTATCVGLLSEQSRENEGALISRTYAPKLVPESVKSWRAALVAQGRPKIAERIACPTENADLFEELHGDGVLVDVAA